MFISLHNHTEKSNIRMLDCIIKPKDLVNRALELGYSGIAITDHECLSAAIDLLKIKDEVKETRPDFKFIFGNEIYLIDEKNYKNNPKYYHFILLAKDLTGWNQLKQLSSRAWERSYVERGLRRCPTFYSDIEEIVGNNPGHVLASTACLGGELACDILAHRVTEANAFIRWGISVFGQNNFALELQPSDSDEQITVNKVLIKLAEHYGLTYLVTTDSHYLEKEDFNIHSAFLNSKQSSDRETEKFYKYTYVMSESEIANLLQQSGLSEDTIKNCLDNTISFTKDVEQFDFRQSTKVPELILPDFELAHSLRNWYDSCPLIKEFAYSSIQQNRYLIYLIEKGIIEKNIVVNQEIANRINEELDIILYISNELKQNISAYLNLVQKIVDLCWTVSFLGVARGSAACFLINYIIGITQVNPMDYDIPSFRFLNKARADALPDIDIDVSPNKTGEILNLLKDYFGSDNVLNCATFKTESLKAAILTAMKGLGYNNDDAQALTALVPSKRGITYSLSDCLVGDEEKGYEPVPGFENQIRKYPGVFEAIKKIEGLSMNPSIHASAVYIFTDGYLSQNSLMTAPNGTYITAFNMHDSDDMGALKFDLLRTDAESKLMKACELLLKDHVIEWQGNLKKTYDKYLHPSVLCYNAREMWDNLGDNKYSDIFQLDTSVGKVGVNKMRPHSIPELSAVNGLIRLQVEPGEESPVDRYVRFKENINLWYEEMDSYGLTSQEKEILKKYALDKYGVAYSQEDLMRILMDPGISSFTLKDSDKARKTIAKKHIDEIESLKEHYFSNPGGRQVFREYVWDKMIVPQLGYSFNLAHGISYSLVALQELNVAYCYNPLYWQCACLCINAGNSIDDFSEDTDEVVVNYDQEETPDDESDENDSEVENKKAKSVAPNYGKIAKAIDDAQHSGVRIELPNINTAEQDFIPDIKNFSIIYSLAAINVVSSSLYEEILNKRPFTSIEDFLKKVEVTPVQMLGLIKAGCFDDIENIDRLFIIEKYLTILATEKYPIKEKLTTANLKKALDLGINLSDYEIEIRFYKFKKYLDRECQDKENRRYIISSELAIKFFKDYVEKKLNLVKNEYGYLGDGACWVKMSAFERVYKETIQKMMDFLNTDTGKQVFAAFERKEFSASLFNKYCSGNQSSWEMSTMSFYHSQHELAGVNNSLYNICNFNDLDENPSDTDPYYCCIAGTVIDSDKIKHLVSISTIYGVVNVKLFSNLFGLYNQKISSIDPVTKKKIVIEQPWFKRGTKIIVHGFRRENMFVCKTDRTLNFPRTIGLIETVRADGTLDVRYRRKK